MTIPWEWQMPDVTIDGCCIHHLFNIEAAAAFRAAVLDFLA
jgi:hypothetical protein